MKQRFLAYFFFVLGFLTVTFFRHYKGDLIPNSFLFWLVGLIMFGIGFWLLRNTPSSEVQSHQKRLMEAIRDIKENGEKIMVDLTQCELKEHSYVEEREKNNGSDNIMLHAIEINMYGWGAISAYDIQKPEQVQVNQTVIIFSRDNSRTGHTDRFVSRVIPRDKVTLGFYLIQQKQTTLYVDKSNPARYYFDLDFLAS
ncbi:hypothetical protein [Pinibacter soli]|uniref:Uncharacterized protein n=1 Tax=Pinibacter soli TaxID=3044211 RepID=A0ABT6RFZ7_9BACT|nr:hypothetical protein [Pinibacter soli]MDI3321463.1 hypothetical protein [Pinibacter soli]